MASVCSSCNTDASSACMQASIMGHSMGGHGALVLGLRNPQLYQSISAFSPICNPSNVPWGEKAFSGYLGDNEEDWKQYDATELAKVFPALSMQPLSAALNDVMTWEDSLQACHEDLACYAGGNSMSSCMCSTLLFHLASLHSWRSNVHESPLTAHWPV